MQRQQNGLLLQLQLLLQLVCSMLDYFSRRASATR